MIILINNDGLGKTLGNLAGAQLWSIVLRNPTIKILVRRVVKPSNHKPCH